MALTLRRFWAWPGELRRSGVLGINRRNAVHVMPCNPRRFYPRVDDKLLTKIICEARKIPVPRTYAVIERHGDIRRLAELMAGCDEFVIKPASGSEGRGIVVIAGREGEAFLSSSGERWTRADLHYHLSTILSGLYSLGGQDDRAILEQRIVRHPVFDRVAVGGTPDIRVILYRCVPVMAMVRLPTQQSRGRANLHQGAVAAAIHLGSGVTFGGVCRSRAIEGHPDTGAAIAGLCVPGWRTILEASMTLAEGLELGYLGVDFVLDAAGGPVVLEANARPGLAIQVAHRKGLVRRLALIDAQTPQQLQPQNRLALVNQLAEIA